MSLKIPSVKSPILREKIFFTPYLFDAILERVVSGGRGAVSGESLCHACIATRSTKHYSVIVEFCRGPALWRCSERMCCPLLFSKSAFSRNFQKNPIASWQD